MKRTLSLLLLSALLLTLVPAAFAADSLNVSLVKEVTFNNQVAEAPTLTITNTGAAAADVTIQVYDEAARMTLQTLQFTLQPGDAPFGVNGFVYKPLQHDGQINTYRYQVTTAGGYKRNFYFAQIMHIDKTTQAISYTHTENPHYARNTVTSFGPQFRIVTPDLTKEWYMFTPIDLTVQGRQTVQLIGGNARVVGEVYVDVYADQVTVTYSYFHENDQHTKVERISEYLNFFPAYSTITTVDPDKLPSTYAFGKPFSIAAALGGDTNVLMFVRNRLSYYRYPMPTVQFARNYPKSDARMAERGRMLGMMDPVPGLDLANDHNYAN